MGKTQIGCAEQRERSMAISARFTWLNLGLSAQQDHLQQECAHMSGPDRNIHIQSRRGCCEVEKEEVGVNLLVFQLFFLLMLWTAASSSAFACTHSILVPLK
ncbi:hypothetical protein KSP39_PZI013271 [Platanthera zijinensis]|uniref:Uncharacterized protein n=1 Tax=Platanthera zijinensis TaxID=2320716 RepID=A0AAP0BC71_9ASPA